MKRTVYFIALNAIVAALYAALTVVISPLAYGDVQFRFTEIMIFLALYDKRFIPGLILGCFIANLFSPMIAYDLTFGTAATAIAVVAISFVGKFVKEERVSLFIVPFIGAIANGLLVGLALHLAFDLPYIATVLSVGLGEISVLLAGSFIFLYIGKISAVRRFLCWQTSSLSA